jgi:hypothetical protein
MAEPSSDFVVRFNGVKLSKTQEAELAAQIQNLALQQVAKLDLKKSEPVVATFPRQWWGIWIDVNKVGLPNVVVQEKQ